MYDFHCKKQINIHKGMSYIDREKLIKTLERKKSGACNINYRNGFADAVLSIKNMINNAPAEDVAPIVRCKDCKSFIDNGSWKFCEQYGGYVTEMDFCSRAIKI